MLTEVRAGPFRISGISVGGVYTSLLVPELDVILDVGIAPRSFVGANSLFISHAHADHIGALASLVGLRGLSHQPAPRVYLPAEIAGDVARAMDILGRTQHRPLEIPFFALRPGDELQIGRDLWVRAVRTLHSIPSLGYLFFQEVQKLRSEFRELAPAEIRERRQAGEQLFRTERRYQLGYVTDTLIDVIDQAPELLHARVLILEATFLDGRKGRSDARAKCHVHLEEICERAHLFQNEAIVLMHFSQLYTPAEVHSLIRASLPPELVERVVVFAPRSGGFPG